MIKKIIALISLLICSCVVHAEGNDLIKDIENSARSWLALADEGQYTESWRKASQHLRNKKTETDWVKTIEAIRRPLGLKEARYIATAGYTEGLSGFPKGEYVVVQFYTTFKIKGLALETVTLAKENNGVWQVADYKIK
ncbi:MAG: DUF4019 domain-containing protein [Burkholderiales bacterium]|nr:DUF4019 domain-containing protein [Nitrosomonas sp.]MCP5274271.1 DUF4019 domain-containing protein [Burkholderiales bacterium]